MQEWRQKTIQRKEINWSIKNYWTNLKYISTLKKWKEKRISKDFRLKTIYKTKNYFIEETNQNELAKKKFKSTIKKKRQKHDKIVLPAKSKLNRIEVLIY